MFFKTDEMFFENNEKLRKKAIEEDNKDVCTLKRTNLTNFAGFLNSKIVLY